MLQCVLAGNAVFIPKVLRLTLCTIPVTTPHYSSAAKPYNGYKIRHKSAIY